MTITLPYPPTVNHYYTVARGRKILSSEGRSYKVTISKCCLIAGLKPIKGNVVINLTAYRPRKVGDLDNVLKPILDSIKGWAFDDDKQIVEINAKRCDDKENPRIELEVVETLNA